MTQLCSHADFRWFGGKGAPWLNVQYIDIKLGGDLHMEI